MVYFLLRSAKSEGGMVTRRTILLLASTALAVLLLSAGLAPAQESPLPGQAPKEGVIPGRYIVVLEEGVQDPTAVARGHARRHGAEVLHTYQHAIKGYAARLPERRLEEVRADRSRRPRSMPHGCRSRWTRSTRGLPACPHRSRCGCRMCQ